MKFKQKQIWLVDFEPSFGHEYKKIRPGLIVEDSDYIESNNLIVLLPLSSKVEKSSILDVIIQKDNNNRLMTNSLIKVHQISSFDKRRLIKFIGVCSNEVFEQVKLNLQKYLSL